MNDKSYHYATAVFTGTIMLEALKLVFDNPDSAQRTRRLTR